MSIKVLQQQLDSRWDSMPGILREAMSSDVNSGMIWEISQKEHLPDEKIYAVSRLTGYILMGFIHPEDLANEIKDSAGIDIRIASNIADSINKKIFQPLRDEIDKIYAPALSVVEGHAGQSGATPVMVEEIVKPAVPPSVPQPPQSFAAQSRQVPSPKSAPAPFILHQESESHPLMNKQPGLKINIPEEKFGSAGAKWAAPPKPAHIETSYIPQPAPKPASPKPQPPAPSVPNKVEGSRIEEPRVVHYSEMKTPVPPVTNKVEGPKQPTPPGPTPRNVVPENLQKPELPSPEKPAKPL
ncbi:MAG: hypothetical protein HY432_03900 [Candidatus Liptonbacteria bacterium]|nr:hypothetical protein [Candidatus Liptonbacteria bacterium]